MNEDSVCDKTVANVLKSLCTLLTVSLVAILFHMYQTYGKDLALRNFVEYSRPLSQVPFWKLGLLPEFLVRFTSTVESRALVENGDAILDLWTFFVECTAE